MQKNRMIYRGLAAILCLAMVVGFLPAGIFGDALQANAASDVAAQNTASDTSAQSEDTTQGGAVVFTESFDSFYNGIPAAGPAGWLDNDTNNANLITCQAGFNGFALQFQNSDGLWVEGPAFDVKAGYDYTVSFMAIKNLNNSQFTGHAELIFLDANGKEQHFIMGCYGVGVTRTLAAVVEQHNDEAGIIWPANVAPAPVLVVPMGKGGDEVSDAAERLAA
jgi:hypothetical protein